MANQQRRSQPRAAGEARAGGRPDGSDANKDRLIFCITSLVGQKVTASLRNNVQYEGTFHSCALDGDYSITLKSARRLPSESNNRSGEVVPTLLIPGKDFLQVSALNVPPPSEAEQGRKGFATDAEISRREGESQRELVPWQGDGYGPASGGGLEDGAHEGKWDQFAANEKIYGVATTWNEDIYTTKLDKSQVPQDKRDKADQIAREIESGNMHTEVEDRVDGDGDGDEEARFSAAQPLGNSKALQKPLPQVPERPGQDMGGQDRGGRKGMISEMKRINALNLEPTSAKHDETTARSRMNMKDAARGNAQRMQGTSQDLKAEFTQSLEIIAQQDAKKRGKNPESNSQWDGNAQNPKGQGGGAMAKAGDQSRQQSGSFSFNPKAPSFSLNPQAADFTPGGGGGGQAQPPAKPSGPSPSFSTYSKKAPGKAFKGGLSDILEMFFQRAKNSSPDSAAPDWPDAKGPSYKDVLGQPNPSGQRAVAGANQMHMQNAMAQGGTWQTQNQGQQGGQQATNQVQQQQQVPQQNAPQNQDQQQGGPNMGGQGTMPMQPAMMPQGFVVAGAPGPGQGNQPNQMQQYGNMYGGPGQQGQPHQGQGMGQPTIVFNQAPVMGQGGSQMVPTMIAQGQQGQMGVTAPMAKFPGQQQQMLVVPMMLAGPNQYGNGQGFGMQGPMQGGTMPPQGGGQGDGGQGQMMQQNMYPRQQ